MLVSDETTLSTPHPKLRIARARAPEHPQLPEEVAVWIAQSQGAAPEAVRAQLKAWIAEYVPSR